MRADICKGVNLETLDNAIAEFERDNYSYYSKNKYNYLIMSEDTIRAIALESSCIFKFNINNSAEYKGDKIAIDNSIPYGKVEIR